MGKRATNWDFVEKSAVISLVGIQSKVLESKKIDASNIERKKDAWQAVLTGFKAQYGDRRSLPEIKAQWKMLKGVAKKEHSYSMKETKLTGGGLPSTSPTFITHRGDNGDVSWRFPINYQQARLI